MKKFFLFMFGLGAAVTCMAQQAAVGAIIRNWDGGDLEIPAAGGDGILRMSVGETKKVNYILEPANADPTSVFVEIENLSKFPALAIPTGNSDYVSCIGNGVGTIFIKNIAGDVLAQVNVWADYEGWQFIYPTDETDPDYKATGQIAVSYDINYKFYFWRETLGGVDREQGAKYIIPDYDGSTTHNYVYLWQYFRDKATGFDLNYVDSIGANAFSQCTNLRYQIIPENVTHIGDGAFIDCPNLSALEFRSATPPTIARSALMIDGMSGSQVPIIIVPKGAYDAYDFEPWNLSTIIEANGELGEAQWSLSESDSISQGLKLSIENYGTDLIDIPGRDEVGGDYPWDALEDQVGELRINDGIRSIGQEAFSRLSNLKAIQFNQRTHPIESIHWTAFSNDCGPWKFAFGDPNDGPLVPPTITGINNADDEAEALLGWEHFMWETVLYVPDATVEYNGQEVRAVDLYREHKFWGLFNKITDRTVDVKTANDSIRLTWLPLENAKGYQLTIHRNNCTANCDTTIFIPATGLQGLIDFSALDKDIPQYLAAPQRRAPRGDDGGGAMTLTISIKTGSGEAHNEEAEVSVSNMAEKASYSFTREVLMATGYNTELAKGGDFKAPESTAIGNPITDNLSPITAIYDLLGRPMGSALEALPEGLYIIERGTQRQTILLSR